MRYAYIPAKRTGKVHEVNEATGQTYCKAENGTPRLVVVLSAPPNRKPCWCCTQVKRQLAYESTHGRLDSEFRDIVT